MIAGVPYDAEVEYLESTGEQWINTGVVPGTNTAVETTVTTVTTSQDIPVFGTNSTTSTSGSHSYHLTPYRNRWYWGKNIGTPDGEANGGTYANVVGRTWKIRFNFNGTIAVNDVEISADAGIQPPKDSPQLLISLRKGSTGARYGVWRYYNFKVYENGVLVRDLIPVRVGNMGYMYDRVTRKLFGNQGTGAFGYGLDTATPVMGLHRYPQIGGEA